MARIVEMRGVIPCEICTREECAIGCCFQIEPTCLCHNEDCMFYDSESDGGCAWGLEGKCGANTNASFDTEEKEDGRTD